MGHSVSVRARHAVAEGNNTSTWRSAVCACGMTQCRAVAGWLAGWRRSVGRSVGRAGLASSYEQCDGCSVSQIVSLLAGWESGEFGRRYLASACACGTIWPTRPDPTGIRCERERESEAI